jgi:adenosylmethionine-8-amino-7-oxononanoate aminotransferase
MGRVGSKYACAQENISADIVVLGKALAGGYAPLGAVVIDARIHEALRGGSGAFRHGHSFHGHTLACAAGLAVQEEIARNDLLGNVDRMGKRLSALLEERFGDHPNVGDIRGRGLMQAIELVEDLETKRPFHPSHRLHARIKANALDLGLICYPSPGTIDGQTTDHVLLMPPFIEELVAKLERAIAGSLQEVRGKPS